MKVTPELLEKYYRHLCTPEERQAVESWQENADIDFPTALPPAENQEWHKSQIWEPLAVMMQKQTDHNSQPEKIQAIKLKRNYTKAWRIAACLLVSLGIVFYFVLHSSNHNSEIASKIKTIKTKRGQKANFTLSDGTIVWLNDDSECRFTESFSSHSRVIHLTGEAHFKVAKDASRPFIVYTASTKLSVLGTVFNLKSYPGEDVSLAVEEGKVKFGGLKNSPYQIYTANQTGVFTTSNKLSKQTNSNNNYSSWTKNKLVFSGQTLEKIIPILERWYNVSIHLDNNYLKHETFTGEFDNPPINFLLSRLAFVMKFKYTINNKSISIN